jgi:malate dehydrogenase (oxaloacetate-decarboxylating)(NADP+)
MIRAAYQLIDQGIAEPVLIGDSDGILRTADELQVAEE